MYSTTNESDERRPLLHTTDAPQDRGKPTSSVALILTISIFGVFLASADDSFLTATYSTIASEFDRHSDAAWLLMAYNIGYCYALPVYGSVCDTYGRKRPLVGSYILFSIGCVISGTATSFEQAIAGRVITGFGGAGMIALASVIITDLSTLDEVAVLRSYVNAAAVAGKSAGAPLGGLLADIIGWRWSFTCQAPLALVCLTFVSLKLTAGHQKKSKTKIRESGQDTALWREIDWSGAIFSAIGLVFGLAALSMGGKTLPWSHPLVMLTITGCIIFMAAFAITELFWARSPLISPKVIATNGIGVLCVIQILLCAARFGTMAQISPYFIRTQNASDSMAGVYLVPALLGNVVGTFISSYVISRTLRYKTITVLSFPLGILSYLLMTLRWRYGANAWEAMYYVGGGLSFGMGLSSQFIALSAAAPEEQQGAAIGLYYLSQQVGMIFGTGGFSALQETVFHNALRSAFRNFPSRDKEN